LTKEKKEDAPTREAVYGRGELIDAASSFGVKPEVMAGALHLAGKDVMTRAQAENAIKRFLERKV
jgi:hypothetical protein